MVDGNDVMRANKERWDKVFGGIGNFFRDANNNAGDARKKRQAARSYSKPAVKPSGVSASTISPDIMRNGLSESSGPMDYSANNPIANIVRRNSSNPTPMRGGNYPAFMQGEPNDPSQALFDELLGKITSDWGGLDKSKIDYSPLDAALNARIGALNGVRSKSQSNFETSDDNLESMHRGFQNHIQTKGKADFNAIADKQKADLTADNNIAQANLQQIKAQDQLKRQEMLKNLGIQAAGAAPDQSATGLNQALGSIESRENADQTNASQDRASNQAYNQGIATSVGQAGVERRADLATQLQQILGRIDMAEADAKSENAQARYQLEQQEAARQYDQFNNNRGFLSGTLEQLQEDAFRRDELAAKQQSQQADPREIGGYAGLQQDLLNSGFDIPEIQDATGKLSSIMASDYRKGVDPNAGYTQTDLLMQRLTAEGVPAPLAFQLATNYANLGNTSKYTASPY